MPKLSFRKERFLSVPRYSFASARVENMMKATDEPIPERVEYSILWKYHALGQEKVFTIANFVERTDCLMWVN